MVAAERGRQWRARQRAAGRVDWRRWLTPEDVALVGWVLGLRDEQRQRILAGLADNRRQAAKA